MIPPLDFAGRASSTQDTHVPSPKPSASGTDKEGRSPTLAYVPDLLRLPRVASSA
jgi:hypothetical protein